MADVELPAWCAVGARVAILYRGTRGSRVRFVTVARHTKTLIVVTTTAGDEKFRRSNLREVGEGEGAWGGYHMLADPASPPVVQALREMTIADIVYGIRKTMENTRFPDWEAVTVLAAIVRLRNECNAAIAALDQI